MLTLDFNILQRTMHGRLQKILLGRGGGKPKKAPLKGKEAPYTEKKVASLQLRAAVPHYIV